MRIILMCLIGLVIGFVGGRLGAFVAMKLREKKGPLCSIKVETFPEDDGESKRVRISYSTVDTCPTIDDAINHLENAIDHLKSQRDEVR